MSEWNTATVRELLNAVFSDEKLISFCYDHFRPVHDEFGHGMSKGDKVQRLIDHCERNDCTSDLLARIKEENPAQYTRFEPQLNQSHLSEPRNAVDIVQVLADNLIKPGEGQTVLAIKDELASKILDVFEQKRDNTKEMTALVKALKQQNITITGDGNIVGDNNQVIRIEGSYAKELVRGIGEITTRELKKDKNRRWCLVGALVLVGVILLLVPWPRETPPVIQEFLVHYPDNSTKSFTAGDLVELSAYTPVMVEAIILDQDRVSCTWSTVKGLLLPVGRCGTQYNPPPDGNQDTLTVLAQSPRKRWQKFAGLHISVQQAQ